MHNLPLSEESKQQEMDNTLETTCTNGYPSFITTQLNERIKNIKYTSK